MADIRSFLGGGGHKQPSKTAASALNSPPKPSPKVDFPLPLCGHALFVASESFSLCHTLHRNQFYGGWVIQAANAATNELLAALAPAGKPNKNSPTKRSIGLVVSYSLKELAHAIFPPHCGMFEI